MAEIHPSMPSVEAVITRQHALIIRLISDLSFTIGLLRSIETFLKVTLGAGDLEAALAEHLMFLLEPEAGDG